MALSGAWLAHRARNRCLDEEMDEERSRGAVRCSTALGQGLRVERQ